MKNLLNKREKDRIDSICKTYSIYDYTINSNGTIEVDGDVNMANSELFDLPLKFGKVSGNFTCCFNALTTLDGAPHTIGGTFNCYNNDDLLTLVGGPSKVGSEFNCSSCGLSNLIGAPSIISSNFYCYNNVLTSLEGIPATIKGTFDCENNRLTSTYSGDIDTDIDGVFLVSDNDELPKSITDALELSSNVSNNIIKIIVKYQRHYYIWNDDLTLNEENFQELLGEIKDGLA